MTPQARQALEYVRNAAGNATGESFMDDHAPIGQQLWHELRSPKQLIHFDPAPGRDRFIVLTEAGRAAMTASPPQQPPGDFLGLSVGRKDKAK